MLLGLGLNPKKGKKKSPPSPRAEVGQENIETVHEANTPYKPRVPSEDRVAVLWKVPTAHIPNT